MRFCIVLSGLFVCGIMLYVGSAPPSLVAVSDVDQLLGIQTIKTSTPLLPRPNKYPRLVRSARPRVGAAGVKLNNLRPSRSRSKSEFLVQNSRDFLESGIVEIV